ncbi:MAG: hypothetical protein HC805_05595 [Alkalinema sp. RL_2_19]|nr:hypothetical protein [Alkalinema sp. RL_2_19]
MINQELTALNQAIHERLDLCNNQVEEYKEAEQRYGEPVERRQRLAAPR